MVRKIKTIFWVAIIVFSILIPIALAIIIPILVGEFIWLPLLITVGVQVGIAIIIGIIFLIVKIRKKSEIPGEIDEKEIVNLAVQELKNDEHDPDNFQIYKRLPVKIGEKGVEKTPMLILIGWGTETHTHRVCIINIKNTKEPKCWLKNIDDYDEILNHAIKMAESQPEEEKEKIITTRDQFGMPIMTREIIKPSHTEKEKEKEEAEQKNII